jgi:hypothetical protein
MRRAPALALVTVLLLVAPALAGCLAATGSVRAAAYLDVATIAPGAVADYAIFVANDAGFHRSYDVAVRGPDGWKVEPENDTVDLDAGASRALLVAVTAPRDAKHALHEITVRVGGLPVRLHALVQDRGTEAARAGVGVKAHTVGFWPNGTVFYTNMKEIRDNPAVPSHDLSPGVPDSYLPLQVYVGGERGKRAPEPYNRSGYVPVIKGFDERLRGMHAGDVRATRIPPEKAYTLPGNEKHALYGDALNFVVLVRSVDVLPPESKLIPLPAPTGVEGAGGLR